MRIHTDIHTRTHGTRFVSFSHRRKPSIVNGSLYGGEYDINKCNLVGKPLSQKCLDFFIQEQCAYECDPNFGMRRVE